MKNPAVQFGVDPGNKNVDFKANIGRNTPVIGSFSAHVGDPVDRTATDSGDVFRLTLKQPHHQFIGVTAEHDSEHPEHDTSQQRYYSNAPREGTGRRELSVYYQSLIDYAIGMALLKLEGQHGEDIETPKLIMAIGVPHNHYTSRLIDDISAVYTGERVIEIDGGKHPWTVMIESVEVRSQLYYGMFSQYVKLNQKNALRSDKTWLSAPVGVIDVGSHSFQVALFEPKFNEEGEAVEVSATKHNCQDFGMWTLVPTMQSLILESDYGDILGSLSDWDILKIIETGEHNGISFAKQRKEVLDRKAPQLIKESRKPLGTGDKLKKIVLVGRGNLAFEPYFRDAYQTTAKMTGLQIITAIDDHGNLAPGEAPADGAWKKTLVLNTQPKGEQPNGKKD